MIAAVSYPFSTQAWSMLTCEICSREFSTSRLLRLHFKRKHVDKSQWNAKCEVCGKVYADYEILKRHQRNHQKVKNKVKCPDPSCNKSFLRKSFLIQHIANNHPDRMPPEEREVIKKSIVKKQYCCSEADCSASFGKHHLLTQHSFVHTGIPPFQCNQCEKRFTTLAKRKNHEKVHDGYPCKTCNVVSPTWTAHLAHVAEEHKQVHTCDKCEKSFHNRARLNEHLKIHLEVRPVYACPHCDRTFTKKYGMKKHISVVHDGERLFKCCIEGCGKSYAHCQSLKKHIRVFHSLDKPLPKKKPRRTKSTASKIFGWDSKCIARAFGAATV